MLSNETYKRVLRNHLAALVEKNPRFSMRAFAKKLGLSPSHLSRVLNGKKTLSYESAVKISQELDIDLIEGSSADNRATSTTLTLDTFKVISDWYHFPIIELIRTKGFCSREGWIAKRLGLPLATVQAALDRLEALKLIERIGGEIKLLDTSFVKTADDQASSAIRKHHEQMMAKAVEALNSDGIESREFQGININFDNKDLADAKKMIRDFYKKFNRRFSKQSGEEVYQMNLQFFKLTRGAK